LLPRADARSNKRPKIVTDYFLAGGLGVFEQHVRKFERAWFAAISKHPRAKIFTERHFPRWGKWSGAARKYPRQDPLN